MTPAALRTITSPRLVALAALALWGVAIAPGDARAWSPGPTPLAWMAAQSDACLVGKVTALRRGLVNDGDFEVAAADLAVERWLFGHPQTTKLATVVYFVRTDNNLDVAYTFGIDERVLVCGEWQRQVAVRAPRLGKARASSGPSGGKLPPVLAIRFAKARNIGYKLTVSAADRLNGLMAKADPRALADAEVVLKAHQSPLGSSGFRGRLWHHDRIVKSDATLHPTLRLQHLIAPGAKPMRVPPPKPSDDFQVAVLKADGSAVGTLAVTASGSNRATRKVKPGEVVRWAIKADLAPLKLPPGDYLLRLTFKRKASKKDWRGTVETNTVPFAVR